MSTPHDSLPGATVAAFDFDGTLTRGGSVFAYLIRLAGLRRVLTEVLELSPRLLRAAVAGGARADQTKEVLFTRLLAGLPADWVVTEGKAFAQEHLERRLRPTVAARLRWHKECGHQVVVVSASPETYVEAAGEILGVDGVLATGLAVDPRGLLTGHYQGKNCRGHEKYQRLVDWMDQQGLHRRDTTVWAYGNSRGDLHLLASADHGVDAGMLGRFGRLRRFVRLEDLGASSNPHPPAAAHQGSGLGGPSRRDVARLSDES